MPFLQVLRMGMRKAPGDHCWIAECIRQNDGSGRRLLSRPLSNTMDVFQCSALGPLLFTILFNNLSLYAGDAATFQYADNTQVLVSGPVGDLGVLISRMEASLASLNDLFALTPPR